MFDLFKKGDNNKVSELETIIKKIKLDTRYFDKIDEKYKRNKSVISTLLKKEDFRYKNLSKKDRNNKKLYQSIVYNKKDGMILKYAGDDIITDFNTILMSVYYSPCSIDYVKKINGISKLDLEELLFWILKKDEKLINFIHNDLLQIINKTKEDIKKLNLNFNNIQNKYELILGITNGEKKESKSKEKFNLSTLLKK
ncbi:hypothetical protein [Gemelliphila palaticanis]|uniref:Uncharacterized protein n=1 Tax=Gemelliphila palaticanis TaxID=81950 RepID=A0ABX2T1F5_9BACL|nr:hypothetical protein [Gemella palaticanis]MBF0716086.1 hypothetical protein [Gemella palaticanis]NYS48016.1 hypothetical protein [Gemella palaticanis]